MDIYEIESLFGKPLNNVFQRQKKYISLLCIIVLCVLFLTYTFSKYKWFFGIDQKDIILFISLFAMASITLAVRVLGDIFHSYAVDEIGVRIKDILGFDIDKDQYTVKYRSIESRDESHLLVRHDTCIIHDAFFYVGDGRESFYKEVKLYREVKSKKQERVVDHTFLACMRANNGKSFACENPQYVFHKGTPIGYDYKIFGIEIVNIMDVIFFFLSVALLYFICLVPVVLIAEGEYISQFWRIMIFSIFYRSFFVYILPYKFYLYKKQKKSNYQTESVGQDLCIPYTLFEKLSEDIGGNIYFTITPQALYIRYGLSYDFLGGHGLLFMMPKIIKKRLLGDIVKIKTIHIFFEYIARQHMHFNEK